MLLSDLKIHLKSNPKLKQFLLDCWVHPIFARVRWWARTFAYPFIIKKGNGSLIRRTARLDIHPGKRFILGKNSVIEDFSIINNGMGDILIGDYTLVTSRCTLVGPVTIGNNCIIAPSCSLSGLTHDYEDIDTPIRLQSVTTHPITIEDDCWIGGNSIILQGLTVGKHSLVAAGSVVTKSVPPYSIVAGNPAKLIRQYNTETKSWERVEQKK